MITKEKLTINLKELKGRIPSKPATYTQEHPKRIGEALIFYCNQRTVHSVQACTSSLNEDNWPLPLWFDPDKVRIGFWNKLYYRKQYNSWQKRKKFRGLKEFDFFSVPVMNHIFFKLSFDQIIIEAFDANKNYAFQMFLSNSILKSKMGIIESVRKSYGHSNWVACISTIFPLIDFVTRKLLGTKNLSIDVSRICKLFAQNGFSLENAGDLMPHFTFVLSHKPGQPLFSEERDQWFRKMQETDFGFIGPALSSFIRFANIYYSYYKEDTETEETQSLNRHAILHGSINDFGTKANTVKLITFLYLMLELEEVFKILLKE
jgi:hypothetical protein